jgi:hypothetical protein
MRTASRCLWALTIGVASVGVFGGGDAFAAPQGGFSVRPANFDPADPATRAYFKPVVSAGGSFTDQVIVANAGDGPLEVFVYPVDGLTGVTSGAVYANRDQRSQKAARWVRTDVATLTVAPHTETPVGFMVRVPAGAPPGDHLAGIAFEGAHPQRSGEQFSITQVIREVVGVQIQVPGPAQCHLHVDGVELAPLAGVGTGAAVVHLGDDGSKLGKPHLCVTLDGPHRYRRTVDRQLDTLLPGDTIPFPLPWPDTLDRGDYTVSVAEMCATPVLYRSRLHLGTTLHGPRQPKGIKAPAREYPWLVVAATALGGLLLGVVIARRPWRPSRTRGTAP